MSSKAPKAPPAPDPYAVAGAQTGSNVTTAIANSYLGNANVNSPLGTSRTRQTGTKQIKDPTTGRTISVPIFTQDIKLSKGQQTLLNQQNQLGSKMNTTAMSQLDRLAAHLSGNPNLTEGLPGLRDGPQNISLDGLPELSDNMDEYRGQVETAMMERMNPQLQRDYDALENRLVNQGLVRGSEAFTTAMNENRQQANDARTQVFLASGNEARAQMGEQRANRGQLFNERVTTNNDVRANLESDMARRNQMLQERLTERNQPINEITALMSGGEVSMPQFSGYQSGQVEGTPVGQYVYQSDNAQRQAANTAAESRANTFNTIGKLGAGLFAWSDRRLKTDIEPLGSDGTYEWYAYRLNGRDAVSYGVMADEVARINPAAVVVMPNGFMAVNYGAL